MINGEVNEFASGLYYGDERIFLYNSQKFFIEGLTINGKNHLLLDRWEFKSDGYIWECESEISSFA